MMKDEMDIMKMTKLQRMFWLKANRATLIFVGIVWIGMIIQQLSAGNRPWFLIIMVPVFALFRLAAYRYYRRTV